METQQEYLSGETSGLVEWQKDELVVACTSCDSKFTFWSRRHHCRCCGSIFCSSCSSHFAYYDKRKVKVLQRNEGVVEAQPYRTCNSCHETLLQRALLLTKQGKVLSLGSVRGPSNSSPQDSTSFTSFRNNLVKGDTVREAEVERSDSSNASGSQGASSTTSEEYSKCPICNEDLANFSEGESASHVQTCLEQASNIQQHHLKYKPGMSGFKNRILVYLMPDNSRGDGDLTECPICFEDMEPGQKIGRLECLCVFHYDCIKSWLKKKSEKMSSTGCAVDATKNFCPLHDAIF